MELVALLYNIRSLHNVGSVFRTADGAGIKKIYLCGITPSPLDSFGRTRPQLSKVSLGAERTVEWDASARSARATIKLLEKLKSDGYRIIAIEQAKKSVPLGKVAAKKGKACIVMGNEVNGLPPSVLKLADTIAEIPMRGAMVRQAHHPRHAGRGKESLNVSVAFGVAVYAISGIIR